MLARIEALLRSNADLLVAAGVAAALAAVVAPVPPGAMDYLLAGNLAVGAGVLVAAAGVRDAGAAAALPSALLLTALLRLVLGVLAARLILVEGEAGRVVEALGSLAGGGSAAAGAVVFGVLVVVQLIVVARGSERAAEVAARFALDAMPGAQMSIDADLRAGLLRPEEARARRRALEREARLRGAMDGAMKFVRGDAAAGVVLALATLAGGVAVGVARQGLAVREALEAYTLLTVGAGLALLAPSLMVSIGAGLALTRAAAGAGAGSERAASPAGASARWGRALAGVCGVLGAAAALSAAAGAPWAPFAAVAALAGAGAAPGLLARRRARLGAASARAGEAEGGPLVIEAHATLEPTLRREASAAALDAARAAVAQDLGLDLPAPRVRAGRGLPAHGYAVHIHGAPAGAGVAPPDRVVALCPAERARALGVEASPLALAWSGGAACAAPAGAAGRLREGGVEALGPAEVVARHAGAALRRHAPEFVGVQETRAALDRLESTHPDLVREVTPGLVPLPVLAEVLRRLVREGVPVRDLAAVLGSLARWGAAEKSAAGLAERVRADLARLLCARLSAGTGRLRHFTVDPEIEDLVRESAVATPAGPMPALSYADQERIIAAFRHAAESARAGSGGAAVVVGPAARPLLATLLGDALPELAVLSHEELAAGFALEPLGMVSLGEPAAGAPR